MNELLKKDITIKIISISIAILLWFYVLNSDNPYKIRTLVVPLRVENENVLADKGLVLKNRNFRKNVEVSIRGRQEVVNALTPDDFEIILDFSKVKSADDTTLRIDGPYYDIKDINLIIVSPRDINIELERVLRNSFPVQVTTIGNLKPGYKLLNVTASPDNIQIESVESLVKKVDSVKIEVDISNIDRDKTFENILCGVYDKDGQLIDSLSNSYPVNVKVEVAKEVPIIPDIKGQPAKGYIEIMRKVNPEKVLITGPYEVVSQITELKTEPITIDNISSNLNSTVLLKLPNNVNLVNAENEISVNITIEKLVEREVIINKEDIGIINADDNFNYQIQGENIIVVLKGREAELGNVSSKGLRPSIDVSGGEEGTHNMDIKLTVPPYIELIQGASVEVKIEKK